MKNIKLTDDPLTNIKIMVPHLDDRGRAAVSGLIFGMLLAHESDEKKECGNRGAVLVER